MSINLPKSAGSFAGDFSRKCSFDLSDSTWPSARDAPPLQQPFKDMWGYGRCLYDWTYLLAVVELHTSALSFPWRGAGGCWWQLYQLYSFSKKNLKMEKVAVLVVEAKIPRDDDNYTLLPVFQDVAHLGSILHYSSVTCSFTSSPRATQWSRRSGRSAPRWGFGAERIVRSWGSTLCLLPVVPRASDKNHKGTTWKSDRIPWNNYRIGNKDSDVFLLWKNLPTSKTGPSLSLGETLHEDEAVVDPPLFKNLDCIHSWSQIKIYSIKLWKHSY